MDSQSLERSIVEVIGDSGFFDILSDAGEIILDDSLNDGLIKDVPFIGTIAKLFKAGIGIKGYLFAKKLNKFMIALKDIPSKEREQFNERLNKDKEFQKKVGEQLLLTLDRLDDVDKPYLVAHAFEAFMKELIEYEDFLRLASAIDKTFFPDLVTFKANSNYKQLSTNTILNLVNSGILELEAMPSVKRSAKDNKYKITDLGKQLLDYCFKE